MNNKDTFELLQDLYDSIDTLIFTFENDDWYKMVNIDKDIKNVKKCYNKLKEYDETE